jgi:hypothetical protein
MVRLLLLWHLDHLQLLSIVDDKRLVGAASQLVRFRGLGVGTHAFKGGKQLHRQRVKLISELTMVACFFEKHSSLVRFCIIELGSYFAFFTVTFYVIMLRERWSGIYFYSSPEWFGCLPAAIIFLISAD